MFYKITHKNKAIKIQAEIICARITKILQKSGVFSGIWRGFCSTAIGGVDADIVLGEVAGFEGEFAVFFVQFDGELHFIAAHFCGGLFLAILGVNSAAEDDGGAADFGGDFFGVEALSGVSDGHEDTSDIGVFGGEGGFDEGGAGDGFGGSPPDLGGGAEDADGEEFFGAFAVADNGFGEDAGDFHESAADFGFTGAGGFSGGAGGHHQKGVVCGGVAVDGDGVECLAGDGSLPGAEFLRGEGGVYGDESQHCGHIGVDHAGALGDSGEGEGFFAVLDLPGGAFVDGVGGHNGAGGGGPVVVFEFVDALPEAVGVFFHGKPLHNDSGGKGQDGVLGDGEELREEFAALAGVLESGAQGSGVCDAGVDGEGADGAVVLESLPADLDGGGGEAVLGEDAGDGGVCGEGEDGEVVAGFGLDGAGGSDPDAANGEQGRGRGKINRHVGNGTGAGGGSGSGRGEGCPESGSNRHAD